MKNLLPLSPDSHQALFFFRRRNIQQSGHRLFNLSLSLAITIIFLSSLIPLFVSTALAQGQLQNWNTGQREKAERLLSAAMTALNKGQLDRAAGLLIQSTAADPTDAAPFGVLGMTYLRQDKPAEALAALQKSYQISRQSETLLSTGFAYYLQHDYDAAIAAWTKALEHDNNMVEVNADIGFAYLRKGDFVKADESFRYLIKARPSSQLAYQGLALVNFLAGNLNSARKAAEHAQSIQSYYPVLLLLAQLDFLQGDPQTGQKRVAEWQRSATGKKALVRSMTALGYPVQHDFHWDPFLKDNFDNGRLLLYRTETKEKRKKNSRKSPAASGKSPGLLKKAEQAQSAVGQDFYLTRELALVEMAGGDYAASSEHFTAVLQLCPLCLVDWLHLARVQAMQNKTAEAAYAVQEFQRQRRQEKIAESFLDLFRGVPAAIPELSPQPVEKPRKETPESGF